MVSEINSYVMEYEVIRSNPQYLDPLKFWYDRRDVYPCLFQLALKTLSIPATSVLSKQCFSKAGNISTSGRARLEAGTVEKLVYLQRSMKPIDVDQITAEELKEERRHLEKSRDLKLRTAAYESALASH